MNFPILKNLRDPVKLLVFTGVAFLVFDISYYFMAFTLGTRDNTCLLGAGLTPLNIIFSVIISLLSGLLVTGLMGIWKRKSGRLLSGSSGGIGLLFGGMTVFCTFCTIPVITLLGFSVSLSFFTTYALAFKIIAIILMLIAAHRLNRQLLGECSCDV